MLVSQTLDWLGNFPKPHILTKLLPIPHNVWFPFSWLETQQMVPGPQLVRCSENWAEKANQLRRSS